MTAGLARIENYNVSAENELDFDVIGIEAAILNSVRRIIMSDITLIAIERVFVLNNTSVLPDEVLAHRLGLLPILADPKLLTSEFDGNHEHFSGSNCFKFGLRVSASSRLDVLSQSLQWIPMDGQDPSWNVSVQPEILVTKLASGQQLDLELFAVRGTARDHAKWGPVCSAFYRQIPKVRLLGEVSGKEAEELAKLFSDGVIAVDKHGHAIVRNERLCLQSPEYIKSSALAELVSVQRRPTDFIFHIESSGFYNPASVLVEACKILKAKCAGHRLNL